MKSNWLMRLWTMASVSAVLAGCSTSEKKECVECRTYAPAPTELTAEYRTDPAGLDVARPRLSWKMKASARAQDVEETAYRILAASSPDVLAADKGDLWDSGKATRMDRVAVAWGGKALVTSERVYWKVMTWNNWGVRSKWSAPAEFVMGVMKPEDWKARWIGPAPETRPDVDFAGAQWITGTPDTKGVVTLRYAFDCPALAEEACVSFVHAATPQHTIEVNGKSFNLWSGHVHDARYVRFRNLRPWLKPGKNEMVVKIAKGENPAFIARMRFPDGTVRVTDASWQGTGVKVLGGVKDTPFGRSLVVRHEIASPAFEKTFTVSKAVQTATLHVTGVGFYEASLDGAKIGKKVLDPSPTVFDRHVLYSTYPMEKVLKPGTHTLRLLVGHGWYDVRSIATWNFEIAPWRDFPRAIAQLEIVYADGTRECVVTDGTWRQVKSPVGYDCIREGEVIGTNDPTMPDLEKTVVRAVEVPAPKGALVAEAQPGAEVMRRVAPRAIHALGKDGWMIEFPENMAGWVRMRVKGQPKGRLLTFRYDERVNADFSPAMESVHDGIHTVAFSNHEQGRVKGAERRAIDVHFRYTASHDVCADHAAFQTDRFMCSGAAEEIYEPRFTYNGFQYVWLRGFEGTPKAEDIEACIVHTAFPTIGRFTCSDPTFNTLMAMAERAYRSNFVDGVPTDCPHREKNGWTGDASIASELAQYFVENTAGYEKWLRDLCDTQNAAGDICCIAPTSGWGFQWGNGPAWDSALPVVAWNLYLYRDDARVLDAIYPTLSRYLAFTAAKHAKGGLVSHGLGDWIPVNRAHMPSTELTSSCYYLQAQRIAAGIAAEKGLAAEAAKWRAGAETTRAAIHAKFYKGKGVYDNGGQTAEAFPLAFGVTPPSEIPATRAALIAACEKTGGHVDMGLLGTKHVFRALSLAGRTDLAFKMLTNPTKPSPVEWIQKGGTTLWEDWGDGASRNHIMFGDFVAWAYEYLAGIRLPETESSCAAIPEVSARAFRHVVIAPEVIPQLNSVTGSVNGPYGEIASSWKREGSKVTLTVNVPPNTTALVKLPTGERKEVGSGVSTFVW